MNFALVGIAVFVAVGVVSLYEVKTSDAQSTPTVTAKYEFEPIPPAEKYAAMLGVDSRNVRVTTENDEITIEILNVIPPDDTALLDYASKNGLQLKK